MSVATLNRSDEERNVARGVESSAAADRIEAAGRHVLRYGLVLVLLWIGGMKFTRYEAEGIAGLVSNSPLLGWAYQVFSVRAFSAMIGFAELLIAVLIAARPFAPRLSAVGSALAAGMFITTITFLVSTPGVVEPSLGFPALSVAPGQFLVKDIVLLGAALWTTAEALRAARRNATLRSAALHGYDPVAYFTHRKPTQGNVAFASQYDGKQYYFESSKHQQMFERNPQEYLPQYDGYCAFGVAMGQLFDVDPTTGQVIDGKLYLNLNRKILADFNKDRQGYIEQADKNWPEVGQTA